MNDWWKAPVLQGPENDYGDYDYLIEKLPQDIAEWRWFDAQCGSCGKHHHLNFYSAHHFYTYDGWDSMDYTDCWMCTLKCKIYSIKHKIKKRIKTFTTAMELYKTGNKPFKEYYELAKKIVR